MRVHWKGNPHRALLPLADNKRTLEIIYLLSWLGERTQFCARNIFDDTNLGKPLFR